MTSPIPAAAGTPISTLMGSAPTTSVGTTGMDKDTFLKLLVAQMRYQDPQSPTDSSALVTQSATYSQVEAMQKLTEQNASMLAMQRASSAGALVGRTVSYTAVDGTQTTGLVTSVALATDDAEAVALVDGIHVPVGRLTTISVPASTAPPSTAPPSTAPPSTAPPSTAPASTAPAATPATA